MSINLLHFKRWFRYVTGFYIPKGSNSTLYRPLILLIIIPEVKIYLNVSDTVESGDYLSAEVEDEVETHIAAPVVPRYNAPMVNPKFGGGRRVNVASMLKE